MVRPPMACSKLVDPKLLIHVSFSAQSLVTCRYLNIHTYIYMSLDIYELCNEDSYAMDHSTIGSQAVVPLSKVNPMLTAPDDRAIR